MRIIKSLLKINIVGLSSCSSQLGFLVARNYLCAKGQGPLLEVNLILVKSVLADKNFRYSILSSAHLADSSQAKYKLLRQVRIKNTLDRGIVYFLLIILKLISHVFPVVLWQPRPKWLDSGFVTVGSKKINLSFPRFKQILFGDGFMQFCETDRPFWLDVNQCKLKQDSEFALSNNLFLYLYCLQNIHRAKIDNIKIVPREYILNYFQVNEDQIFLIPWIDNILAFLASKIIHYNVRQLYILPTSTFSETSRSSLESEFMMYQQYLQNSEIARESLILLKPHPGSSSEKVLRLLEFTASISSVEKWEGLDLLGLSMLPMELIIYYLIYMKKLLREDQICLSVASTATLSCLRLFPSLRYELAFGDQLVNQHINSKYSSQRIKQERLMAEHLDRISSSVNA